jgi:hypothetical protein
MKTFSRILSVTVGCLAFLAGAPAQADDSEVFTSAAILAPGAKPNVLFIIDTSGSMDTKVNVFNPAKTYPTGAPLTRPSRRIARPPRSGCRSPTTAARPAQTAWAPAAGGADARRC